MIRVIVLDSGPLGLLTQRPDHPAAIACNDGSAAHVGGGVRFAIAEITDYELRRELLRLNRAAPIGRLDARIARPSTDYLPLTTAVMRRAAELWADLRRAGTPTSDPHALDGDVILAAQAMSLGLPPDEYVVATTNVGHLARLVPAKLWSDI